MIKNDNFTPMVPFMPANPQYYHAYVPYQIDIEEYNLAEALNKGSLFTAMYSDYRGNVGGGEVLC